MFLSLILFVFLSAKSYKIHILI